MGISTPLFLLFPLFPPKADEAPPGFPCPRQFPLRPLSSVSSAPLFIPLPKAPIVPTSPPTAPIIPDIADAPKGPGSSRRPGKPGDPSDSNSSGNCCVIGRTGPVGPAGVVAAVGSTPLTGLTGPRGRAEAREKYRPPKGVVCASGFLEPCDFKGAAEELLGVLGALAPND